VDNEYGRRIREQFADNDGNSELAMLEAPSRDEFEQLKTAVAIMTAKERENAAVLDDEDVVRIAKDAGIDQGIFAIFINGYILECKRVS
jgi:signal recognition particle GTPase